MAELNHQLFCGNGGEDNEEVDLGDWVVHNGTLTPVNAPEVEYLGLPNLSSEEVLQHLLMQGKRGRVCVYG